MEENPPFACNFLLGGFGLSVSKAGWAHTQDGNKNAKAGICEPQTEGEKEGSKERETEAPIKQKECSKEQHVQHEQLYSSEQGIL